MSAAAEPMTLDEAKRIGFEAMRVSLGRLRDVQGRGVANADVGACVEYGSLCGRQEMLFWVRSATSLEQLQNACEWEMLRYAQQVLE